jgi:epoxyqueuosine reductase
MASQNRSIDFAVLAAQIKQWSWEFGFQCTGISDIDLSEHETHLLNWLGRNFHGEMDYMARHGTKRSRPSDLVPGTNRIISVRMDYYPPQDLPPEAILNAPHLAYISRYALGRDYHKVLRRRLQQLAGRITKTVGPFGYRVFVDSAPVLEKAVAAKAGLGWIGKHTNLLTTKAGSWFFLGELYTDLPLPTDTPTKAHCGTCQACIDVCPTKAIRAPYQLDARRCIAYLTIELRGPIPVEYRPLMGNRIFGCDDCQLACPWNRFAHTTTLHDFKTRLNLDNPPLIQLFMWNEQDFLKTTEGSAIRRIGYECWLRNIAVALGNAPTSKPLLKALMTRRNHPSALVREHVEWALAQHNADV